MLLFLAELGWWGPRFNLGCKCSTFSWIWKPRSPEVGRPEVHDSLWPQLSKVFTMAVWARRDVSIHVSGEGERLAFDRRPPGYSKTFCLGLRDSVITKNPWDLFWSHFGAKSRGSSSANSLPRACLLHLRVVDLRVPWELKVGTRALDGRRWAPFVASDRSVRDAWSPVRSVLTPSNP